METQTKQLNPITRSALRSVRDNWNIWSRAEVMTLTGKLKDLFIIAICAIPEFNPSLNQLTNELIEEFAFQMFEEFKPTNQFLRTHDRKYSNWSNARRKYFWDNFKISY